jgi:hypothetical protein
MFLLLVAVYRCGELREIYPKGSETIYDSKVIALYTWPQYPYLVWFKLSPDV